MGNALCGTPVAVVHCCGMGEHNEEREMCEMGGHRLQSVESRCLPSRFHAANIHIETTRVLCILHMYIVLCIPHYILHMLYAVRHHCNTLLHTATIVSRLFK